LSVAQSGVGTYTASLYEYLSRLDVEIVPLTHYPAGYRWSNNGRNGRRPRVLNKTLWMQALLPLSLTRLDLEVCHFTNNVGPIWSPRPTVLTLHDMTLWLLPEFHTARRIASMRPIIPLAARRAAAVITVSQSAKTDIVRVLGLTPDKVRVIYEAPSPHFHRLTDRGALEDVRRRYDLPERFVLHVGTLEPRKNLIRLLKALAMLRQAHQMDHRLVLVGNQGWHHGEIFAAVERFDLRSCVQFAGYVPLDDLVAVYNLADALVFPSLYEGFGLPVVEAMACGTPVVTTTRGSLREIAGDAAIFVEPTETESIADGLRQILEDANLRAELRQRGQERVKQFSWERAAHQTLQVYQHAVQITGE
jgi:glycosyltransferase involved in cell wall biosynthesis